METKEAIKVIERYYKNSIELNSLKKRHMFASIKNNIIFGVEMRTLDSVINISEDKDYFTETPIQKLHIKVKKLDQVKEILTEMDALKQDTDNILFEIAHSNHIETGNPFYLVINIFKTLGV